MHDDLHTHTLAKRNVGVWYSMPYARPRVPRGGVTRQGVVLTALPQSRASMLIVNKVLPDRETERMRERMRENSLRQLSLQ